MYTRSVSTLFAGSSRSLIAQRSALQLSRFPRRNLPLRTPSGSAFAVQARGFSSKTKEDAFQDAVKRATIDGLDNVWNHAFPKSMLQPCPPSPSPLFPPTPAPSLSA
eukprot:3277551-Rhodomonas_salina.1